MTDYQIDPNDWRRITGDTIEVSVWQGEKCVGLTLIVEEEGHEEEAIKTTDEIILYPAGDTPGEV